MNSPAKNALRLKMAGLIFTLAGLVAFMVLGDKMGDFEKPVAAAPRDYVFIAGAWLVAAHLCRCRADCPPCRFKRCAAVDKRACAPRRIAKASRFHPDYSVLRNCGS